VNEPFYFSLDRAEFDQVVYDQLSE
jgi:hypothetical protein